MAKKSDQQIISEALDDLFLASRQAAAIHHRATSAHLMKAMSDPDRHVRQAAEYRRNVRRERAK